MNNRNFSNSLERNNIHSSQEEFKMNHKHKKLSSPSMERKRLLEKESRLFHSLKSKTHPFFKDSMIESCSHVIVKNGQTLAVPFDIRNSKGRKLSHYKTIPLKSSELTSVYRKDFSSKPIVHAGMLNKPLEPYNPSSYRNRLSNLDYVCSQKNKSSFEIGDIAHGAKKQFTSTYKNSYTTPICLPICNTGILSDIAKKLHKKIAEV